MSSHKEEMVALDGDPTVETVGKRKRPSSRHLLLYIVAAVLVLGLLILVLGLYFGLKADDSSNSTHVPQQQKSRCRSGQSFQNSSISSDTAVCSEIGCYVLEKNGSAVDAAIAAMLCISVVTMHSSGIGGGAFMLVYEKKKRKAVFFDARETAPGAATEYMYVNNPASSSVGPLSAAVPGEVKGMMEAHKHYGKLKWRDLVQPSIDLAKEGFVVTSALARAISISFKYIKDPSFRKLLTNKDGSQKREGDTIVNHKLAQTLQEIQRDPESFYTGNLAKKIAADFQKNGGLITEKDLKDYSVNISTKVLKLDLRNDVTMFSCPPPSGGTVVTQILNILQNYNFSSASIADVNNTILTYHRIIEAFKFAYAKRPLLGDPAFVDTAEVVQDVLDVELNRELYNMIWDNFTHNNFTYYDGSSFVKDEGSTTHLSVFASNGDAVSVTSSVNYYFGGKFRSNITGIIYNNEMDDFSTPGQSNGFNYPPSKNNYIAPGKRPLSSMSPTIFVDRKTGEVRLVVGAAGGSRIITSTAWVSLLNLWMGLPLDEAVNRPRLHNQLFPPFVKTEKTEGYTLQDDILQGLERKGHEFEGNFLSVVQAVGIDKTRKTLMAISDPRKGGDAWGL